jgi:8-oxo-dGTP diphosphatase
VIIEVVAAVIREERKVLITQRLDHVDLAGFWEFPGGKVKTGESLEDALEREIREELGIKIRVCDEFFTTVHQYPTNAVRLHFFNCTIVEGEAQPIEVADLRWIDAENLCHYHFPPADTELISKLRST